MSEHDDHDPSALAIGGAPMAGAGSRSPFYDVLRSMDCKGELAVVVPEHLVRFRLHARERDGWLAMGYVPSWELPCEGADRVLACQLELLFEDARTGQLVERVKVPVQLDPLRQPGEVAWWRLRLGRLLSSHGLGLHQVRIHHRMTPV